MTCYFCGAHELRTKPGGLGNGGNMPTHRGRYFFLGSAVKVCPPGVSVTEMLGMHELLKQNQWRGLGGRSPPPLQTK